MPNIVQFVGDNHALQIYNVKLVGVNAENGKKLLFTVVLFVVMLLFAKVLRRLIRGVTKQGERSAFWARQGISLFVALVLLIGTASIWFDDPKNLVTAVGLITAGLAFALQRVVTSLAGYLLILRGRTFNVGDRIVMGGVRGDVMALGFLQTTIMEMGQPPPVQNASPAMWVNARQYTGRIVSVSNAQVFDEPVFNYTRDFPYIWDEITIPITYDADRHAAERILLDATQKNTVDIEQLGKPAIHALQNRYFMKPSELKPRVYWRITDNWLELTVRFIAEDHGVRALKDAISRDILVGFDKVGIGIASATYDIVGFPPIRMQKPADVPSVETPPGSSAAGS